MVLDELVTYLASQGIGTAGVDLFYGTLKDTYPDAMVLLQEYGGLPDEPDMGDPGGTLGNGIRLEYPRIQVLCRGARDDYNGPRAKARAVRTALNKVSDETLSGVRYVSIDMLQPPFRLRTDANFRDMIAFNIQVTKHES